ncbi:MAG: hypothetical protein Q8N26_17875 [Myxococcales bacterium]|nr:hypothetical protein [Myxococcales bacterium]
MQPSGDAFWKAADFAGRFFMGQSPVHAALEALAKLLDEEGIPYAVCGAMALNAWGYERVTNDVDVLMSREGLERFKLRALGRGYVEKFAGSKGVKDTVNGVGIDVLLEGEFPGDGKPKPVVFPNPSVAVTRGGLRLIPLSRLVELKLASGMTAAHRLKDLADVLELVKAAKLPLELAATLDASVRVKYEELWHAAQVYDPISES